MAVDETTSRYEIPQSEIIWKICEFICSTTLLGFGPVVKIIKNIVFVIIAMGLIGASNFAHQELKWPINILDLVIFPLAFSALVQAFLMHRALSPASSIPAITWRQLFTILLAFSTFAAAGSGLLFLGLNGRISNPEHIDCVMHIYTWALLGLELIVLSLYLLYQCVVRYLFDI